MDQQEIERLLYSGESDALDFKRDQYPLTTNDEKGELVKDILAFANSWRTTEAFILVGVDETKVAGKSTLVGISTHLKDSDIQQLVNSKTNRKVTFIYEPVCFQGLRYRRDHGPRTGAALSSYGKLWQALERYRVRSPRQFDGHCGCY